jgi:hypothetical protein
MYTLLDSIKSSVIATRNFDYKSYQNMFGKKLRFTGKLYAHILRQAVHSRALILSESPMEISTSLQYVSKNHFNSCGDKISFTESNHGPICLAITVNEVSFKNSACSVHFRIRGMTTLFRLSKPNWVLQRKHDEDFFEHRKFETRASRKTVEWCLGLILGLSFSQKLSLSLGLSLGLSV